MGLESINRYRSDQCFNPHWHFHFLFKLVKSNLYVWNVFLKALVHFALLHILYTLRVQGKFLVCGDALGDAGDL